MEIHVHIHNDAVEVDSSPTRKAPRTAKRTSPPGSSKPRRKGKPMTRKTQLAINRGRRAKGMKPIKWKKKGV